MNSWKKVQGVLGSIVFATGMLIVPGIASAITSNNWSGYAASGGEYTFVRSSWEVPEVQSGAGRSANGTWIGIGGFSGSDLIQAGTMALVDRRGRVNYRAWYELLPDSMIYLPIEVGPGDRVSAAIAKGSGNKWTILFTNHTAGTELRKSVKYDSSLSSAQWIEEMLTDEDETLIPFSDFDSTTFQDALVVENGALKTLAEADPEPIIMRDYEKTTLAVPGAIEPDGRSFTVTPTNAPSESIATTPSESAKPGTLRVRVQTKPSTFHIIVDTMEGGEVQTYQVDNGRVKVEFRY